MWCGQTPSERIKPDLQIEKEEKLMVVNPDIQDLAEEEILPGAAPGWPQEVVS